MLPFRLDREILFKSRHAIVLKLVIFFIAIIVGGFTFIYLLSFSHASSSSDTITGNASFSDPNNVHIQVNFHRTNNSAYLGFLGCHLANQFYPVGGSPNSTSYTLNKIVPATLFAANAKLNCTGSEYNGNVPFQTATASFSPYGVIDGEAYLQNPTSNTTIQLTFHRLDNQAFLGFFYCGVSGHAFPVGGSPSTTVYTLNKTVPTSWFANNAQLSCSGNQYYNGKGATVKIAQKDFTPYDQISGGVSLSGTTVNVAIHFHRPDNSHFLGFLSCKAGSIYLPAGGSANTIDYYVHGSYPAASYGTATMNCTGSEYRGSTPVTTVSKSFTSPIRTSGGTTPTPTVNPTNTNNVYSLYIASGNYITPGTSVSFLSLLQVLSGSGAIPRYRLDCTNSENISIASVSQFYPQGRSDSQSLSFISQKVPGSGQSSVESIYCTATSLVNGQELASGDGIYTIHN